MTDQDDEQGVVKAKRAMGCPFCPKNEKGIPPLFDTETDLRTHIEEEHSMAKQAKVPEHIVALDKLLEEGTGITSWTLITCDRQGVKTNSSIVRDRTLENLFALEGLFEFLYTNRSLMSGREGLVPYR